MHAITIIEFEGDQGVTYREVLEGEKGRKNIVFIL